MKRGLMFILLGASLFSLALSSSVLATRDCEPGEESSPANLCIPPIGSSGPVAGSGTVTPQTTASNTSLQSMNKESLQELYDEKYKLVTQEDFDEYNNIPDNAQREQLHIAYQKYNDVTMKVTTDWLGDEALKTAGDTFFNNCLVACAQRGESSCTDKCGADPANPYNIRKAQDDLILKNSLISTINEIDRIRNSQTAKQESGVGRWFRTMFSKISVFFKITKTA